MNWDAHFMDICDTISRKSKDRSTNVGAVIVGSNKSCRSMGYNGMPRGIDDDVDERHERPTKYLWFEHAERNAIYNAASNGTALEGCTMYINSLPPCCDCARAIIQSGIIEVVVNSFDSPERWKEQCDIAIGMLKEAKVNIRLSDMGADDE